MNICVCIKQVPDVGKIGIDHTNNTIIRMGVPSIINPYDTYALEHAARIQDKYPNTKIVAVSMGPVQAAEALKEAIAIAADKAYLVNDKIFSGSDTLATSYILSLAIKEIEKTEGKFDCIFCGKQAIDGDTAQVGPELAEYMGLAQITCALELEVYGSNLEILQQGPDYQRIIEAKMPCLITFTKPYFVVRYPTLKRRLIAKKKEIKNIRAEDLNEIENSRCGLRGSATRVVGVSAIESHKRCVILKEDTLNGNVMKLAEIVFTMQII